MPLLDLSLVTKTLLNVIEKSLLASVEAPKLIPLTVSSLSPDRLVGEHAVGFYLYHSDENQAYKNAPPPGSDVPPIQFTPLGLNLYYQLTARSDIRDTGADSEQLLMGLAMKALHDFASIDDTTTVAGFTVMPLDLRARQNIFRVSLMPVLPNEAPHYWTAANQPLRFAAYYQVSVSLLEPEKPALFPSRVLAYGVYSFARGTPFLEGSKNNIAFTPPGAPSPATVEIQPAQLPVKGTITLFGSGLSGNPTTLLIRNKRFPEPIEVGPDWGVSATANTITAVIQAKAGLLTVLPGVYSAAAKVTLERIGPDKKLKQFGNTSNETPFVVTPRIDTISPSVAGVVTIQGGVFQDAAIASDAVQVMLGAVNLTPKAGVPLNPGEFDTPNPATLRFHWPVTGFNPGDSVLLRILVNGAESAPNWVVA